MNDTSFETPYLKTLHTNNNIYDRFVPDQVLTHHNLNKIIDYFEDQDRLSRINTIGVGIGCGLDFFVETNEEGAITIKVNAGVGITTDGDIVTVNTSGSLQAKYEFQYFTNSFVNRANYARFSGLNIFEIHTQEEADLLTGELPLSSLFNFNGLYLLAYVENYSENPGICSGSGCDDTGEHIYKNLKFVLTDQNGFDALTAEAADSIFYYKKMRSFYDSLPELSVTRPLLKSTNTKAQNSIYTLYKNGILSNNTVTLLRDSFLQIIDKLDNRLNVKRYAITESNVITRFEPLLTIDNYPVLDIQYRYDFLKDLIETYHEIRSLLLHINADCVPNTTAFPKHLLLGAINADKREFTRHDFYPSHIVATDDENLLQVLSLIIRFYSQLDQYSIPSNGALVVNGKPSSTAFNNITIKITPSRDYEHILSKRSIPYYYKAQNTLTKNWNYKDIVNRRAHAQLCYHKSNLLNIDAIQNPLNYSHAGHDFYRIEGHLGKTYTSVLSKLAQLQTDYNLNFHVKAISIGAALETIDLDTYSCQFEDLKTLLKAWQDEFQCLLKNGSDFFNKYNYQNLGQNATTTNYLDYHTIASEQDRTKTVGTTTNPDTPISPMNKMTTTETSGASKLIAVATEYAIQATNSTDSEILYKVAKEYMIKEVGGYDNAEEELIYVDYPTKIAVDLYTVHDQFVDDLQVYTEPTALDRFTASLNQLCFDLNKAKEDIVTAKNNKTFGENSRDTMYEFMIYELSKLCCFKSKIQWLLTEIETRKKNIFDQLTLSNLIKNNPGIEHMAGVPKGGTFIIVYGGRDTTTGLFSNKVIADFAYHDLCCNDCPPHTIIIQQETPVLPGVLLQPTVYCITDGQIIEKGTFTPTPDDAVITSDQGTNFMNKENKFDPNVVSDALLGIPITFKVNETPVTTTATVYRIPDAIIFNSSTNPEITITINDDSSSDNPSASVTLTPTTPYQDKGYLTYTWTDENGTKIGISRVLEIDVPIVEGQISKELQLEIGINNPDATCSTIVPIRIREKITTIPDEVGLELTPDVFCFEDDQNVALVPFLLTPENGIVTSDQGTSFIENDNTFDPNEVQDSLLDALLTFKVNNQAVTQTAQVYKIPNAQHFNTSENSTIKIIKIDIDNKVAQVSLTPITPYDALGYLTYQWLDENGTLISNSDTLISEFSIIEGRIEVRIKLQLGVNNPSAACSNSYLIELDIPVTVDNEDLCFEEFGDRLNRYPINDVLKRAQEKTANTEFGTDFAENIIRPTFNLYTSASQLKEDDFNDKDTLKTVLDMINALLQDLSENYIQNNDRKEFLTEFLLIHEALAILFLELIRCCSDEDVAKLAAQINAFENVIAKDKRTFEENNRDYEFISQEFYDAYTSKSENLRALFRDLFNFN
ncbi:hypothetical protein GCM10022393_27010 [Aquimarina addita]|uniref:Ig-like domain-containing protein n=1 Tax=Aquimarina addita TaxID=870485 RepID=A0ABP6ULR7_9FLAO